MTPKAKPRIALGRLEDPQAHRRPHTQAACPGVQRRLSSGQPGSGPCET